jgi:hypothetical protein
MDVQIDLIATFREDFAKYAPYSDKRCLNATLSSVAQSVGQQIRYSRLAEGFSNPTIKKAFDLLCMAQVLQKIRAVSPAGFPLGASANERRFKAIVADVGLMNSLCNLPTGLELQRSDLLAIYQGAMAEQFVGQELAASGQPGLFYWSRAAKSSTAEVDFLIQRKGKILPVEVKSGAAGRLRSLHLLAREYPNLGPAFVLSAQPYSSLPEQKLTFLPLYYAYLIGMPGA